MTVSNAFDQAVERFAPGLPLVVAFSGGADSTALLLACANKWPGQVHALHIHHGLQPAADAFERHCSDICLNLGVPFAVSRVSAGAKPGQSPEQAARAARYQAFFDQYLASVQMKWASPAIKDVAIAQHADDQVETVLLALSRGAGVAGLAAMPARWQIGALTFHRPLLAVPAADLRGWLLQQGATWIEDPSNADERFTRNRIRARLLPALEAAFPQFRATFARTATHAAQAAELLAEIAAEDLEAVGVPPLLTPLRALSVARRANAIRHWLKTSYGTTPETAQLRALMVQIEACTTRGHHIRLKVGRGTIERCGDRINWTASI